MADDATSRTPGVFELPRVDNSTDTRDLLAHAAKEARALKDTFVVDVDAHLSEFAFWGEIVDRIDNDVYRQMAQSFRNRPGSPPGLMNATPGMLYQDMFGRIPHQQRLAEKTDGAHAMVTLVQRAMDTMGIDYMVVLPTPMLVLGMHPQAEIEAALGGAFNKWMVEDMLPHEKRMKNFIYLPFNDPPAALKEVEKYADNPGVVGFMVTSTRYKPVHHDDYMKLYAAIEASGKPITFHSGFHWGDESMKQCNRFLSMHAISFVYFNIVHITNWVINGIPERFPKLKVIWIESGLAWVPFIMQRLDAEYMMRTSEAPLLKRKPSEYIREMFFTTQPMERDNLKLLEATFEAINADTQLLYASDWPHWDFDLPNSITQLPFINEQQKRNILGLSAAKLLNLEVPAHKLGSPQPGPAAVAAQGLSPAAE
ncbi:MAG: amidohydrolase [Beijerinckiaceae bacterium]|nr:amidohydrolase [Beijerinckiaceae bacterium]